MDSVPLTPQERQKLIREMFEAMRNIVWSGFSQKVQGDPVFNVTPSELLRNGWYRYVEDDWRDWRRDFHDYSDDKLLKAHKELVEEAEALGSFGKVEASVELPADKRQEVEQVIDQFIGSVTQIEPRETEHEAVEHDAPELDDDFEI
jgi:hypothetical protein